MLRVARLHVCFNFKIGWKSLDRDGDGHACYCLPGGNGKKCPKKK
ncbi:hypothetical protein [Acinetobacter bereziniae]